MTKTDHLTARPPEPCLKGRCFSPSACNDWGYCRERNEGIAATNYEQQTFRLIARQRKAREET